MPPRDQHATHDGFVTRNPEKALDRNKSNIKAARMPDLSFTGTLLPGASAILGEHQREMPQKNELCGAFWVTLALRAFAGARLEQDHVGLAASSLLSVVQTADSLPPGHPGRDDYVLELPRTDDPEIDSGTASEGLMVATTRLSDGHFTAVPISGDWSASRISALLSGLAEFDCDLLVIANSATRALWNSHASPAALLHYLSTGEDPHPPAEWDVGHFIGVLGWIAGPGGSVAMCADTYPTLGQSGIHYQPFGAMADSLRRDHSEFFGGMLVFVPTDKVDDVTALARAVGLEGTLWDNGTPYRPEAVAG
jgi:hypothetical protein